MDMQAVLVLVDQLGGPMRQMIAKAEADLQYDPRQEAEILAAGLAANVQLPPEPTRRVIVAVCDAVATMLDGIPAGS